MRMEFPRARLLVFAKAPVPGQVKTRLAKDYGARWAADLYQRLLRRTLALTSAADLCPVQLWCAPSTRHGFFAACRRDYGVELHTQRGSDLGQRMHRAFVKTLAEHPYALLIGADWASLGTDQLRAALRALAAGREAVLGPAEDGGYLLIGLRRPRPALFKGIAWGNSQVMAATRRRLRREGLDWLELPPGWDIDHPEDVRRLKRQPISMLYCQAASSSPNDSVV